MENENKKKFHLSKKMQSFLYVALAIISVIAMVIVVIMTAVSLNEKSVLKQKEYEIIEQYKELAEEHELFKDGEYAEVYFEGNTIYIPSKDLIIQYHP